MIFFQTGDLCGETPQLIKSEWQGYFGSRDTYTSKKVLVYVAVAGDRDSDG